MMKISIHRIKTAATRAGILAILALLLWPPGPALAQQDEYTLKALFVEKFTRFIQWPPTAEIDDPAKPFVLGVIGDSPIASSFTKIFSVTDIKDKKVVLRRISQLDEIAGCHLVFIARTGKERLANILSYTGKRPILTVSDTKDFALEGVHINFYVSENKIRFEINEKACRQSGLTISYLLLRLARIVDPQPRS